jgi:SAM-dependent methyltransferase
MTKTEYKDYFRRRYKVSFVSKDISNYGKWFYSQWSTITRLVKFKKDDKVLEIGSGFGGTYPFIVDKVDSVNYKGIELDQEASMFANKHFKVESFINTIFEKFTSSTKFDYVLGFEVLEHVDDPIFVISKIHEILNDNGIFIGTSPYPYVKNISCDQTHKYVLHPDNWKKIFLDNGFKEVRTLPMTYLPAVWRLNKYLNFRIPFYLSFPGLISTTLIIAKK